MARSDLTFPNSDRGGFTLVELLISMTVGLILVAASLSFAITTFRDVEGNKLREEVYRSARFIGMSLQRDVQTAGVGIESKLTFGTINTFNDTLVVLSVPMDPTMAPAYALVPPFGSPNPLPAGGTCGALCLDLAKDAGGNFDLAAGDLARLQVNAERHLIVLDSVQDMGGSNFRIWFLAGTSVLNYDAAFAGGLLLDRSGTSVQKLLPTVYFARDSVLYRAASFNSAGVLQSSPMAFGVINWDTELLFTDGDTASAANATDGDATNDFDDLLGVRITATLATNRPDIRVAGGAQFTKAYDWSIMPRNLMYERNR